MKTRTKLRIILVVLTLVLVSLPYGVGRVAEQRYREFINHLNNRYQSAFTVERYERGMFTSTAETRVDLAKVARHRFPAAPPEFLDVLRTCTLHVRSKVYHGPVPLGVAAWPVRPAIATSHDTMELVLPREVATQPIIIHAASRLHLDGTLETQVTLPPHEQVFSRTVEVTLPRGAAAFFKCNNALLPIAGSVAIPHVKLTAGDGWVELAGLTGTFASTPTSPLNLPARTTLTCSALAFGSDDASRPILSNCTLMCSADASNGLARGSLNVECAQIILGRESVGALTLRVTAHNFAVRALQRLHTLIEDTERYVMEGANPTAVIGALMTDVPAVLNSLLEANPCIVLNQGCLATPHGAFTARGVLSAQRTHKLHAFSFLAPQDILKMFTMDLQFSVPQTFVQKRIIEEGVKLPIDPAIFFVPSNGVYLTRVTMRDAQVFINGTRLGGKED